MVKSIMPINGLNTSVGNNIYIGIMIRNIASGMSILKVQDIKSMKEIPSIMPINDLSTCAGNNIYTGIMTKNIAIDIAMGMCILEVQNIESMKEIPSTNLLAMRHFLYDKLVGRKTNRIS